MTNENDNPTTPGKGPDPVGPARDFAAFCELDYDRRLNSDDDFDPDLFAEAVALVVGKLGG